MSARNSLFGRPRPPDVRLQELGAVIGFDRQQVHIVQTATHMLRDVSQVSQPGDRAGRTEHVSFFSCGEGEANRFLGIVRHREGIDLHVSELESGSGLEQLPVRAMLEFGLHRPRGGSVRKYRDLGMFLQGVDPGSVVTVLMSEKHRGDLIHARAGLMEHLPQLPSGKPRVDQDTGGSGLK